MSHIAIVGAGEIGAATAARLAARDRAGATRLVLIDAAGGVAAGKALDIQQSGPIEGVGARVSGDTDIHAAAGARAIVVADAAAPPAAEHQGEDGLALVRRLWSLVSADRAVLVFAGASQRLLMERAIREAGVDPRRAIGSAPAALESAIRAIVALETDGSGDDVRLEVSGVPPRGMVIGWVSATIHGAAITDVVPPHRIAAIAQRAPGLWPPGPYALGSAASRAVEAIVAGSRRRLTCFVALDAADYTHTAAEYADYAEVLPASRFASGARGRVAAMPARIGASGVEAILAPSLSSQERTTLETAIARA